MRVLVSRAYVGALRYEEIAGTSDEVQTLPRQGLITGSRFTCVDNGNLYLYDDNTSKWNGPFKLYEGGQNDASTAEL